MPTPPEPTKKPEDSNQEGPYIPGTKIFSKALKNHSDIMKQPLDMLISTIKDSVPMSDIESTLHSFDQNNNQQEHFPTFLKRYKQTPVQQIRIESLERNRNIFPKSSGVTEKPNIKFSKSEKQSVENLYHAHQNKDILDKKCTNLNDNEKLVGEKEDKGTQKEANLDFHDICEYFNNQLTYLRDLYMKQRKHFIKTYKANNDLISEAFQVIIQLRDELYACKHDDNNLDGEQLNKDYYKNENNTNQEFEDIVNLNSINNENEQPKETEYPNNNKNNKNK